MGCCNGEEDTAEQRARSEAIDRTLKQQGTELRRECKILLLGAENSGKSTIVKQMKIIHQAGFAWDELESYRRTIYTNLVESAKALLGAMTAFEIEVEHAESKDSFQYITDYMLPGDPSEPLDERLGDAITALWRDPSIPKVLERSNEFYLMDSAPYFFDEAWRITQPSYTPTEIDVLRARKRTTGIQETRFSMGQLRIHMFDVGGQRSERKKWIHCFENVTSIIYVVALNEYDQVLLEESYQNRMMEALILFESIVNSRWFTRTSMILFLNKLDLLKQKLPRSPLELYFPDYAGGNDINAAAKYLLWRFTQVNMACLDLYPHLTQATDTSNIRHVFTAVKETILHNALKDGRLL